MYFVTKNGIYIQGIYGSFETEEEAREHALDLIKNEDDDYHSFSVNVFNSDLGYNTIDTYIRNDILVEVGEISKSKRAIRGLVRRGDKYNMKIKCEESSILIEEERIK